MDWNYSQIHINSHVFEKKLLRNIVYHTNKSKPNQVVWLCSHDNIPRWCGTLITLFSLVPSNILYWPHPSHEADFNAAPSNWLYIFWCCWLHKWMAFNKILQLGIKVCAFRPLSNATMTENNMSQSSLNSEEQAKLQCWFPWAGWWLEMTSPHLGLLNTQTSQPA